MESFLDNFVIEVSSLRFFLEAAAWGVGIILAAVMLRRGGGRFEKLLLTGCILMCFSSFARIFSGVIHDMISWDDNSFSKAASMISIMYGIPLSVLTLTGFVCLVIAFWYRFWVQNRRSA